MTINYEEIEAIKEYVDTVLLDSDKLIKSVFDPPKELYPDSDESREEYLLSLYKAQGKLSGFIVDLQASAWGLAKMRDSLELPTEEMIKTTWKKIDNLKKEINNLVIALLNVSKAISERSELLGSYIYPQQAECKCKQDD